MPLERVRSSPAVLNGNCFDTHRVILRNDIYFNDNKCFSPPPDVNILSYGGEAENMQIYKHTVADTIDQKRFAFRYSV
jgi:hypothetical protein